MLTASLLLPALAAAGCGTEGVAQDATVSVYVSVPMSGERAAQGRAICAEARRELARSAGRAGELRVRATCLDDTGGHRHWTLAAVGANARRATEDSSTIGYIGELDPAATRFSHSILEAANIAQLPASPTAMPKLLHAIRAVGTSGSLRESVRDDLAGTRGALP
jgi:branched-chain amino acid transport system substrate-binding protein